MTCRHRDMVVQPAKPAPRSLARQCGDTVSNSLSIPELPFEDIRIVSRLDGRHVRLSNGRRNRAVGRYASVKMGATVPWESRLELDDLLRAEVDPAVLSYFVQPETLLWKANGNVRRYTPDRLDLLADGRKRIIEIKETFKPASDPRYAEKLEQAAQIYRARGYGFELHECSRIRLEPLFSAIEHVQAYRRAVVTTEDLGRIRAALAKGSLPLERAVASLERARGLPVLFAMMVRRIICIDLSCGVHDAAAVSLVQGTHPCGA